jgi:hypothetical protein
MKNTLVLVLSLLWFPLLAQELNFKIVNAESLNAIPKAQIKISGQPGIAYTDAKGLFKFNYKKGDTLTIRKDNYHSLHIIPTDVAIDAQHIITISMVPGNDIPAQNGSASLQSFEYNFIHDTKPNNQLKAQVVESPLVTQKRTTSYFKIASMHLTNYKLESKQQKQYKAMDAAE